jgi:hypothetical protein
MSSEACQYELDRLDRIKQNNQRLHSLGLLTAKDTLTNLIGLKKQGVRQQKPQQLVVPRVPIPRSAKEGLKVVDSPPRPNRNPRATVMSVSGNNGAGEWVNHFATVPTLAIPIYQPYVQQVRVGNATTSYRLKRIYKHIRRWPYSCTTSE